MRFLDMQIFDMFVQNIQNVFILFCCDLKFVDIIQINENEKWHKVKIFKNVNHIDTARFEDFDILMSCRCEVKCEN